MNYTECSAILSKTILFENITPMEITTMLPCLNAKIYQYNRNDFLAIAGDSFDGIGILLSGQVEVIKENASGSRIIMSVLEIGDMFGEMVAFSKNSRWPASIHALEACTAVFLSPDKIIGRCEKACSFHNVIIQNMLKIISDKALILSKKVDYLSIKSMRGKLSTYFLEQQKKTGKMTFMLPMKRNELADFLNVSRPSMSREMCRMRDEGIIDFNMSTVKILDLELLKNFSE